MFNVLSECFDTDLRQAWDRRGRAKELKTRRQTGPSSIELKYREGEEPDETTSRVDVPLHSPDVLAVNTLGQLAEDPRACCRSLPKSAAPPVAVCSCW